MTESESPATCRIAGQAINRRAFFLVGLAATGGSVAAVRGEAMNGGEEPKAMGLEEFSKVEVDEFSCKDCPPEVAIYNLGQLVLKKTGKLLRIQIEERKNPQDLSLRIALHRPLTRVWKKETAIKIFTDILAASLWHWDHAPDGTIIVKAWHRPQIDE